MARNGTRSLRTRAASSSLETMDLEGRRRELEGQLKRSASDEELCLYLQFPRDAVDYFRLKSKRHDLGCCLRCLA